MNRFPGRKTGWAWTTSTFFGAGLMKPAPGTWGSVAALALWIALGRWGGLSALQLAMVTAVASLAVLAIGIPAASIVERESDGTDPGHVVIDEVCGQWIALIACPMGWKHFLLALLLFRAFDILKPWPARQLEGLPRGWGIMFDDVAAGLYALLAGRIIDRWI
jgi:phosphatidylglycerophosphatase A